MERAETRRALQRLDNERAALLRVAGLVARDASSEEVLEAVAAQASQLVGVDFTTLLRFEPDGSTEIVAVHAAPAGIAVGMRARGDGDGAVQTVFRTGRAARMDDLSRLSGHWPRVAHGLGFTSSAAAPVLVGGHLWGAIVVTGRDGPLSQSSHDELAGFAELAGTAVSAAQTRRDLRLIAEEQAALRRVAELVARGVTPEEVFAAVTVEASELVNGQATTLVRYDGDAELVVMAIRGGPVPVGERIAFVPGTLPDRLLRSGRSARVDDYSGERDADLARQFGLAAAASAPVLVAGEVWGTLTATSNRGPLPDGTEDRLAQFAELVGAAIANAESHAQLTASRARVIATADEARRRLQRDVHDGAQQRLVQTLLTLSLARDALAAPDSEAGCLLDEALGHAQRAADALRDVVHGIMPVSLERYGLRAGIDSLAVGLPVAVHVEVTASRFAHETEITAWFIVAEALTNVVKHAQARRASVRAVFDEPEGRLRLTVSDDGIGGADPRRGTGLTGLADRVAAAEGSLAVTSGRGEGTTLDVVLPARALARPTAGRPA